MYEITQLFFYKPLFMAELLIAEWIFTFRLKRRSKYYFRLLGSMLLCILVSFAIPIVDYGPVYSLFMFFGMFVVSLLALWFIYDVSLMSIVFCGMAAYTAQHIAHQLYSLISVVAAFSGQTSDFYGSASYSMFSGPVEEMTYFTCYCVVYWLAFIVFANRLERGKNIELRNFSLFVILSFIVIIDIIVNSVVTYYSADHFDKTYMILLCICNVFCCLSVQMFQFELLLNKELRDENAIIHRLWEQAREQYEASKENIELINVKVHDVKHQLHRMALSQDERQELDNLLMVYDAVVETGNDVLNVILTEKSLLCGKKGIRLSCIANAERLDFVSEGELYALFGNLLDNAIEAVSEVEEDKRTISISVKCVREFARINVTNYYSRKLDFRDGFPVTTKPDTLSHGFGIKSCRMIVSKYGGDFSVTAQGNVFSVDVLLPIKKKTN